MPKVAEMAVAVRDLCDLAASVSNEQQEQEEEEEVVLIFDGTGENSGIR